MKKILIFIINIYRKYISPLKKPCCIFYPTCSEYAINAIEKYGAIRGTLIAMNRISRCHPFNEGGYDPLK